IDAESFGSHRSVDIVGDEELAGVSPQVVQRTLRAGMAFIGTVAKRYHPLRAVPNMVTRFLYGLRRNARQFGIRALRDGVHLAQREHAEQQLADDREGKVAFRQLDHQQVAVVDRVSEIRERVFRAILAFYLAGELEQKRRLTDQIERDVRERDVLF